MDEEKKRGARVVMAILLGTALGGALGSFGGFLFFHFAEPPLSLMDRSVGPTELLEWAILLGNPCAHIGAALGCALAWKRAARATESGTGVDGATLAPKNRGVLGPRGGRVVRRALGGSLAGSIVAPTWLNAIETILYFGPRDEEAPWYVLGTFAGPVVGALIGCVQGLIGDRGAPLQAPAPSGAGPAPDGREAAKGRFLSLPSYPVTWTLVVGLLFFVGIFATPNVMIHRQGSNETAAVATLKSLTSAQATCQSQARIDANRDGQGEYGTLLEISSQSGVRDVLVPGAIAGVRFGGKGSKINPPIISTSLGAVDADGIVTKGGYCFRIFLPDSANPAGFVHETGPAEKVGLAGGTGKVGIDASETAWCAYAWPVKYGKRTRRAFFVNQSNDVMQSRNEVAKWSGPQRAPPGNSAFVRGAGITGMIALGTTGNDGDVWKSTW